MRPLPTLKKESKKDETLNTYWQFVNKSNAHLMNSDILGDSCSEERVPAPTPNVSVDLLVSSQFFSAKQIRRMWPNLAKVAISAKKEFPDPPIFPILNILKYFGGDLPEIPGRRHPEMPDQPRFPRIPRPNFPRSAGRIPIRSENSPIRRSEIATVI